MFRENELESDVGNLKKDTPMAILKSSIRNFEKKELMFLVEWKVRSNGVKPITSWVTSQDLRNHAPEVLCDFLLRHIKIPEPSHTQTQSS